MRIAVLSDVHGFLPALQTVLADIERRGPFERLFAAGDHCELGPAPAECLELLRDVGAELLIGNTDLALYEAWRDGTNDAELIFGIEQLGDERCRSLGSLPFSFRVTPPGATSPDDDLLVVHATPHSLIDRFDAVATSEQLRGVLGPTRAGAVAHGHVHVCSVRTVDSTVLVNVAAVGNPKDGRLASAWGELIWDDERRRWDAVIHRLDYPLAQTEQLIRERGVPDAEKVIRRLRRARYKH